MSVQLEYSVSDTPNDRVDAIALYQELSALVLAGSVIEGMRTMGALNLLGSLFFVSVDVAPNVPDRALIDAAVSNHTGTPLAPIGDLITCADGTVCRAVGFANGVIIWAEVTE